MLCEQVPAFGIVLPLPVIYSFKLSDRLSSSSSCLPVTPKQHNYRTLINVIRYLNSSNFFPLLSDVFNCKLTWLITVKDTCITSMSHMFVLTLLAFPFSYKKRSWIIVCSIYSMVFYNHGYAIYPSEDYHFIKLDITWWNATFKLA